MASNSRDKGLGGPGTKSEFDLIICGASFAGLATAWEITRNLQQDKSSNPRILIVDRYQVGERQTSACAAPTEWLEALGM